VDDTELVLHGRVMPASNATFIGRLGDRMVVYKPVAGERPLWDFPDGRLAHREVAAYLVSEALGWGIVPETWLGDGPHGPGMLQQWCEVDPGQSAVTIVPRGAVPPGHLHVFDGVGGDDEPVSLVHEDTPALRRIVVFDAVINNADRKGGHVLEMADGHRHGIDHGIALHHEPKLRTVLWGWAGLPLTDDETAAVLRLRAELDGSLGTELAAYLSEWDLEALAERCERLVARGVLPVPSGEWPAIPWPPF
jgi:uncharacterized repeat protein (TIGR03843 family)